LSQTMELRPPRAPPCAGASPVSAVTRSASFSPVQSGSGSQRATEISLIHKAPPKRLDLIAAGHGL